MVVNNKSKFVGCLALVSILLLMFIIFKMNKDEPHFRPATISQQKYIKYCFDSAYFNRPIFYERDSALLNKFIQFQIDSIPGIFSNWGKRRPTRFIVENIIVSQIFYDSTYTKFQAFTFVEDHTITCDSCKGYTNFEIAGFRNSIDTCWTIYDISMYYIGQHWPNLDTLKNEVYSRWFLWENFARHYFGESYRKMDTLNFKNSLPVCSHHYWTESMVWKIGLRDKTRYPFQMGDNSTPQKPNLRDKKPPKCW